MMALAVHTASWQSIAVLIAGMVCATAIFVTLIVVSAWQGAKR